MAGPRFVRANPSTSQDKTLLLAPSPGQYLDIKEIYISSDTEMMVSLFTSETHQLVWRQYVGARGGVYIPHVCTVPQDEGLDYSTSAAGNVFIMVGYTWHGMKRQ